MQRFYIASDYELMVDYLKAEIAFLKSSWQNLLGRPLVVLTLNQMHLGTILFLICLLNENDTPLKRNGAAR